jgi:antitoxin HicB
MLYDLPGCITYGESINECIANAKEAIEFYTESLEVDGEAIPIEEGILEHNLTLVA